MWLLTTLNRPKQCQEALDAFAEHGKSLGVVWVDGGNYSKLKLPQGWRIHYGGGGIAASMRWFYETYPNLPWYGWLADDMRPASGNFDFWLAKATEGKYFVYCNGGRHKTPRGRPDKPPSTIPSAMVWAGDLVRTVGWWVPPWAEFSCIDEAWKLLCFKAHAAVYVHDVVVVHNHWTSGGRQSDDTDKIGMNLASKDVPRLKEWRASPEFLETADRIRGFINKGIPREREQESGR